jgi:hypothetical protein
MTMKELAERVEAATADDQGILLREAFEAIYGPKPSRVHGGSKALTAWLGRFNPFFAMLACGAFLDAAMTLVPEGWEPLIDYTQRNPVIVELYGNGPITRGAAVSGALALCAAALRAIASQETTR